MGFKKRPKRTQPTVDVKMTRSDGYLKEVSGLSYEAGLAIAVIINRASAGYPVKVTWDSDASGNEQCVEVPLVLFPEEKTNESSPA